MKARKRILVTALSICMVIGMMPVTTFAAGHEHIWAETWCSGTTHHWHECTAANCNLIANEADDQKYGYGAHSYDSNYTCSECFYTCEHSYKDNYAWSDTHHWEVCAFSCGFTMTEEVHNQDGEDGVCSVCYYDPNIHEHYWEKGWTYNSTHHWHVCNGTGSAPCDPTDGDLEESGYAAHSYTDSSDTTCDTCGYTRTVTPSHTHDWSNYSSNGDGSHTRRCTANGCTAQQSEPCDGKATCHEFAICSDCDAPHGGYNKLNHSGGTEVRGARDATGTENGYTGDTYCLGCGIKISEGSIIPATGSGDDDDDTHAHNYYYYKYDGTNHWKMCSCGQGQAGSVKAHTLLIHGNNKGHWKECTICNYYSDLQAHVYSNDSDASCNECGHERHVHNYSTAATCISPAKCSCGATTGGKDPSNHTGGTEIRGAIEATYETEGYTGGTYCKGCGEKLKSGQVIPKIVVRLISTETGLNADGETVTTAQFTTAVRKGTATATITATDGTRLINELINGGSDQLVIAPRTGGNANNVNVTIPASVMEQLGSRTDADLVIATPGAEVTISADDIAKRIGSLVSETQRTENSLGAKVTIGGETVVDTGVTLPEGMEVTDGMQLVVSTINGEGSAAQFQETLRTLGMVLENQESQQESGYLGSYTAPNENPIAGLTPGRTYDASVVSALDVSLKGWEEALYDAVSGDSLVEATAAKIEEVERLKADMEAKRVALNQLDANDPNHMEVWAAWYEAETAYKESLAELMGSAATVTQGFQVPTAYVNDPNVKLVAAHDTNTNPYAEANISDIQLGNIRIAGDGKIGTAVHSTYSFSPFIVYAFVEQPEQEAKVITTSAPVDTGEDVPASLATARLPQHSLRTIRKPLSISSSVAIPFGLSPKNTTAQLGLVFYDHIKDGLIATTQVNCFSEGCVKRRI